MFEQYSYKTKFKALLVLFIMLSIAAYRRSISSLIEAVKENGKLKNKIELYSSKAGSINEIKSEINVLDQMIGKEGINKEKTQQEIVNFLVENGTNVSISDMQPIHEFSENNYKVYTYVMDVTGNFNNLIKVAYQFERQFDFCKIVSTKYYTEKKNNKIETLHLKLIFQKYENY